jgi:hypothetical protein
MQIAYIDLHEELRALNAQQDALAAFTILMAAHIFRP